MNTAENPTLSVNGTTEKPMYYRGLPIKPYYLETSGTYTFVYNGSHWDLIGDISGTEVSVCEYTSRDYFPLTGQSGKIYIDKTTKLIYCWSDNKYIKLKGSLDDLKITDEQIVSVSANKITGSISLNKLSESVYTQATINNLIDGVY